ncbi:MAG: PEP-utilizing enzyme [Thaumarchaeota archaeon]|nr:PEP-utilizing enzyme [Nitrososphaerota archaeon]
MTEGRFPLPEEVEVPKGAENWPSLYAYLGLFSKQKGDYGRFWFQDNLHFPLPLTPFEADILTQYHPAAIGGFNSRVWPIPASLGPFYRVFGGYIYISSENITNEEEVKTRSEMFKRRAGYYFENWESLLEKWREKTSGLIEEFRSVNFQALPEFEPESTVFSERGLTAGYDLVAEYDRLMLLWEKSWYYHFEMFIAYGTALAFADVMQSLFPGVSSKTTFAMIAGIKSPLWEPDEKLKELAKSSIKHGVSEIIVRRVSPDGTFAELKKTPEGKAWLEQFESQKYPYFYAGTAQQPGFYNPTRTPSWIHDLSIPLNFIAGYVERLRNGDNIDRPLHEIARERDRITDEYLELLKDDKDKTAFQAALKLARTAWPYTEEHNWWYDNLIWTISWTKVLELGKILAHHKVVEDPTDIYYLKVDEVRMALHDIVLAWGENKDPRGLEYWPPIIKERRSMVGVLEKWKPPKALGKPPDVVTEVFSILLWGITTDRVTEWLHVIGRSEELDLVKGLPGSPGTAEGRARIIRKVGELNQLKQGEIMVSPVTSPMWSPAFGVAIGVVTDIGGMMSHTAIVCREYGIPAVIGTGVATDAIKTGDLIRVDGNEGTVKILKRSG